MRAWRWLCLGAFTYVGALVSCSPGSSGGGMAGGDDDDGGKSGASGASGGASGGSIPVGGSSGAAGSGICDPDAGPYCGDGMVNGSEVCDDGNALPGDGCTGICTTEPNFDCPPTGGACMSTVRCGDGLRTPGEACDDMNNDSNDGCNADCTVVEPGYYCPTPGEPCLPTSGSHRRSKMRRWKSF